MSYAPDNTWVNMTASRHQNGAVLSFGDGHVERRRWKIGVLLFKSRGQTATPGEDTGPSPIAGGGALPLLSDLSRGSTGSMADYPRLFRPSPSGVTALTAGRIRCRLQGRRGR